MCDLMRVTHIHSQFSWEVFMNSLREARQRIQELEEALMEILSIIDDLIELDPEDDESE